MGSATTKREQVNEDILRRSDATWSCSNNANLSDVNVLTARGTHGYLSIWIPFPNNELDLNGLLTQTPKYLQVDNEPQNLQSIAFNVDS